MSSTYKEADILAQRRAELQIIHCCFCNKPARMDHYPDPNWSPELVSGLTEWKDLVGKTIRVKSTQEKVHAIGYIVKDIWVDPTAEFEQLEKGK